MIQTVKQSTGFYGLHIWNELEPDVRKLPYIRSRNLASTVNKTAVPYYPVFLQFRSPNTIVDLTENHPPPTRNILCPICDCNILPPKIANNCVTLFMPKVKLNGPARTTVRLFRTGSDLCIRRLLPLPPWEESGKIPLDR